MTLTAPPVSCAAAVRRPRRLRALWLLVSLLVLAGVAVVSVMIGSRDVAWSDVVAAFGGSTDGFGQAAVAKRLPRTILAGVAGAALGVVPLPAGAASAPVVAGATLYIITEDGRLNAFR